MSNQQLCIKCGIFMSQDDGVCKDCDRAKEIESMETDTAGAIAAGFDADLCLLYPAFREDVNVREVIKQYREEQEGGLSYLGFLSKK